MNFGLEGTEHLDYFTRFNQLTRKNTANLGDFCQDSQILKRTNDIIIKYIRNTKQLKLENIA